MTIDDKDLLRDCQVPTFLAYSSASTSPTLPGYATAFALEAGLPRARTVRSGPLPPAARFAPAVICTVSSETLRPFMPPADWEVVRVLSDPIAFESEVLRPGWRSEAERLRAEGQQTCRLGKVLVTDLVNKGYLRPLPEGTEPVVPCVVFAVIKSDGVSLRMIWNGVRFNLICNPPPRFTITPMPEMLRRLLTPNTRYIVAWDFTTWFVELRVHPALAGMFTTVIDGVVYAVEGVPMGWAWACAIAQAITAAVTRATMQRLGLTTDDVTAEHCIDNGIVAITSDKVTPDQWIAALRKVAADHGVHLKESSIDIATPSQPEVDWLLYTLNIVQGSARFKDQYISRLRDAQRRVRQAWRKAPPTLVEIWSVAGLVIFSMYAARKPLYHLRTLVSWLGGNAPPVDRPEAWQTTPSFPYARMLWDALNVLAPIVINPPVSPSSDVRMWAITDASGAQYGNSVLLLRSATQTILHVYRRKYEGIADSELCPVVRVMHAAARGVGGSLVLYTDNEVTRAVASRGSSVTAPEPLAGNLVVASGELEVARTFVSINRVDTLRCVADAWTRLGRDGKPVPPQSHVWRRTCNHPWLYTFCKCIIEQFASTGVDLGVLHRWMADPPPRPFLHCGSASWYQGGVTGGPRR